MSKDRFPVVLRFASFNPRALRRILMHARRTGGPLDHVAQEFIERNRVFIGDNFASEMLAELRAMATSNLEEEVAALKARNRKKDAEARQAEGLRDPWHGNSEGPLREVILTAHLDYFRAAEGASGDETLITHGIADDGSTRTNHLSLKKIEEFEARGRAFFETHFPGAVRHLRLDLDEETPHFHAVLMQVDEKITKARGRQLLVKPSANPLLKDYEHAQDIAGEFFKPIGLDRGERRAKTRREARETGLPLPDAARHTSPRAHREKRLSAVRAAEDAARALLDDAQMKSEAAEGQRAAASQEAAKIRHRAMEDAERIERQAEAAATGRIEKAEVEADALVAAIDHGLEALLSGQIEYAPAGINRESDTVRRGPTAPTGAAFAALREMIRPAGHRLVRLARRVAELRQRSRDLDARQDAMTREARLLDDTTQLLGKVSDPAVRKLGSRPLAVGYMPNAFPGAWAVRPDRHDAETVQAALDKMPNRQLRQTLLATRESMGLAEDVPGLQSDLGRAAQLMEFAAAQRGYDPVKDVHDAGKATDETRATLHTDTDGLNMWIRAVRRDRVRQRTRGS